jgi:epoxyqueuosine reductase
MKNILLLHACCGPCLAGCVSELNDQYNLIVFWFNPNIEPKNEHDKRLETLQQLLKEYCIELINNYSYDEENIKWHKFIKGLESEKEGGKRCQKCFEFRLRETAKLAKKSSLSFATTLTISPYKNSSLINKIGTKLSNKNFIKNNCNNKQALKRSLEICRKLDLYRQNYCGCQYSIND